MSAEALEANKSKDYAAGLRTLVKRRLSISTASPYLAAVVAVAEDFIFTQGVLVYTTCREWLRLLDLHGSKSQEIVIDIRQLLHEAVKESRSCNRYKFRPLYYAEGILSCLYIHPHPHEMTSSLVILDPHKGKILNVRHLETHTKIFVRNDRDYLYFGTHSDYGEDGFRRWALRGYDIHARKWIPRKIQLTDMVGSDIGANVNFEIIDGSFYGLSNQFCFEVEETDWNSYYNAIKFPLGQPNPEHMEMTDKQHMFRRYHTDGPIDERWNTLKLEKDEASGDIIIIEGRKEWPANESQSRRTFYKKKLIFPQKPRPTTAGAAAEGNSQSASCGSQSQDQGTDSGEFGKLSNTQPRTPENPHCGDDGSLSSIYTLRQCVARSYVNSCESFIDLMNIPLESDPTSQHISLRVVTRKSSLQKSHRSLLGSGQVESAKDLASHEQNQITFWPQENLDTLIPNSYGDHLQRVLNPYGHTGEIQGYFTDSSLVYATTHGNKSRLKALVFVSFSPKYHLRGIPTWKDMQVQPETEYLGNDMPVAASSIGWKASQLEAEDFHNPRESKSLAQNNSPSAPSMRCPPSCMPSSHDCCSVSSTLTHWRRVTRAMYFEITNQDGRPLGFNFAL
jgi:hypothetical protein